MRHTLALLALITAGTAAHAQCSDVSIAVSASDTAYVQLYHPGLFLIDSGYANVCTWEVTTLNGTLVHQDTTSGGFNDQSFTTFFHSVPITDSMAVTLVIDNPVTGETCTITDTLLWEETEVLPGVFIGNWAVLNASGGISTSVQGPGFSAQVEFLIYPSPATDHLRVAGLSGNVSLEVVDLLGQVVISRQGIVAHDRVDVSTLPSGVYLVRLSDGRGTLLGLRKFSKR